MKINAINISNSAAQCWQIDVEIADKPSLYLSYQGVDGLPCANDSIALLLFIEAMVNGSDLIFPDGHSVSTTLMTNLMKLQEVFIRWYPHLNRVSIVAEQSTPKVANNETLTLFSGGVDSMYTFTENLSDITDLMLCIGLDIQLSETKKKQNALVKFEALASQFEKNLLLVTTNIREVFPDMDRILQHGALLSAMVLALGKGKLLIPASHNINELFPWGSHPLTDPLFTNGTTEVVHHGAVPRSEKTEQVIAQSEAAKLLRVCNSSDEYNCGQCEKCLRTMFVFAVLKKTPVCLPDLQGDFSPLRKIKIYKENQRTFWQDNYDFAVKHQRSDLAKYAGSILLSYHFRQWLKQGVSLFRQAFKR